MNSKSGSKQRLVRQKSMMERSSNVKTVTSRSKTPPARMPEAASVSVKSSRRNLLPSKSMEQLRNPSRGLSKSSKEVLSKEDELALKYNAYLQTRLMIAHSRDVMKRKESKIVRQLEDLQLKLMDLDDRMNELKVTSAKMKLYKQMKEGLTKEIKSFDDLNNSIDISQTNEKIKILENELNILQLKNFHVPESPQTADEIMQCLQKINEHLKIVPDLESKLRPLANLHTSLVKTKENIQQEEILKKECETKLKEADEIVVNNLYAKSLKKL